MGTKKPCRDHLGNEYPSAPEMCAAYGIPFSTYSGRLGRGWTVRQALETPAEGNGPKVNPRNGAAVKDHLGNEFISVGAMCRHWGISETVYQSRRRVCGWPLEKILTEPVRDREDTANAIKITDHTGREHASISAMCRHWNVGLSTYRERRRRGWGVEKALTEPETEIKTAHVRCRDHLGREYPSKNAMCRAWGVTRYCYESRLGLGWTQEQALSSPIVVNAKPCRDHMGRQFPASTYMALYLGLPRYVFQRTRRDLASLVPGLAAKYWSGRMCGRYAVQSCVRFPWFLVRDRGQHLVLHFEDLLDEYHRSPAFRPLPDTRLEGPRLRAVRPVRWPWYLCLLDGSHCVLSYRDLIKMHAASNFGMSAAQPAAARDDDEEEDA